MSRTKVRNYLIEGYFETKLEVQYQDGTWHYVKMFRSETDAESYFEANFELLDSQNETQEVSK